MNNQNIIIFQFNSFFQVMKEIEKDINFNVIEILDDNDLKDKLQEIENSIIITKNNNLNFSNQIILDKFPIKINKVIERLNIQFLKNKFINQSKINICNYTIDLNSKEISFENKKLKLTEKEVKTIIYLSKASSSITVDELQNNVWGYHSDLETHTVETHIYRLRKKFSNHFQDNNFIISEKNGYKIK